MDKMVLSVCCQNIPGCSFIEFSNYAGVNQMSEYREILRLCALKLNRDSIASSCHVSSKTIAKTKKRAAELGLSWPLPDWMTEEKLAEYDTDFFGFPVWWYDLPMPMWTFLESYDFSGKTIIPFLSHEGTSNGGSAFQNMKELAPDAEIRSDDYLSIRGGRVDSSEQDVRSWVSGLGYSK